MDRNMPSAINSSKIYLTTEKVKFSNKRVAVSIDLIYIYMYMYINRCFVQCWSNIQMNGSINIIFGELKEESVKFNLLIPLWRGLIM